MPLLIIFDKSFSGFSFVGNVPKTAPVFVSLAPAAFKYPFTAKSAFSVLPVVAKVVLYKFCINAEAFAISLSLNASARFFIAFTVSVSAAFFNALATASILFCIFCAAVSNLLVERTAAPPKPLSLIPSASSAAPLNLVEEDIPAAASCAFLCCWSIQFFIAPPIAPTPAPINAPYGPNIDPICRPA